MKWPKNYITAIIQVSPVVLEDRDSSTHTPRRLTQGQLGQGQGDAERWQDDIRLLWPNLHLLQQLQPQLCHGGPHRSLGPLAKPPAATFHAVLIRGDRCGVRGGREVCYPPDLGGWGGGNRRDII